MYKIGTGSFSTVYKNDNAIVLKKYHTNTLEQAIREIAVLKYLNHPNIIKQIDYEVNNKEKVMKMEYYSKTLKDIDMSNIITRKWIFYQLFKAIEYCHESNVWHTDIKPENIMIEMDGGKPMVKLADFGSCIINPIIGKNSMYITTYKWRSPEIFFDKIEYDEKIDVWALGLMILRAACEKNVLIMQNTTEKSMMTAILTLLGLPEENDIPFKSIWRIINNETMYKQGDDYIENIIKDFDEKEKQVILKTVEWPNKRYKATEILKLEYFDEIRDELDILYNRKYSLRKKWIYENIINDENNVIIVFKWIYAVMEELYDVRDVNNILKLYGKIARIVNITKEKMQLYGIACIMISMIIRGKNIIDDFTNWLNVSEVIYSKKEIENTIYEVVKKIDMDIIENIKNSRNDIVNKNDISIRYVKKILKK